MSPTTESTDTFTIRPRGAFSLEEAALFGFGQRHEDAFDGTMRLAFVVDGPDGGDAPVGVALTQPAGATVHGTITGTVGTYAPDAVVAQVARVLSLDHDATGFDALGEVDPVIGRLLAAAPGLRPPLFYSPYEAALWAVLSARRGRATGEVWRRRLSEGAGASFDVAGTTMLAVPTPARLLELGPDGCRRIGGFEAGRAERIVGVAEAAVDGRLDVAPLASLPLDDARRRLRTIKGIGPFYADLVLIRAVGLTDVLPHDEPRVLALAGELYGLGRPATQGEYETLAERWAPWRTWASVLIRAAGRRVLPVPAMGG